MPGDVSGLWSAHRRYGSGRVSWRRLFEPSIELARDGAVVSEMLEKSLLYLRTPTSRHNQTVPKLMAKDMGVLQ